MTAAVKGRTSQVRPGGASAQPKPKRPEWADTFMMAVAALLLPVVCVLLWQIANRTESSETVQPSPVGDEIAADVDVDVAPADIVGTTEVVVDPNDVGPYGLSMVFLVAVENCHGGHIRVLPATAAELSTLHNIQPLDPTDRDQAMIAAELYAIRSMERLDTDDPLIVAQAFVAGDGAVEAGTPITDTQQAFIDCVEQGIRELTPTS